MLVSGHVVDAKSGRKGIKEPSKRERRKGKSTRSGGSGSVLWLRHSVTDARLSEYESWAPGTVTKFPA